LLSQRQIKAVLREKQILASLGDNPFVCQLYNTFVDPTHIYFVLEAYTGGELFSIIHTHKANRNGMTERGAQFYAANLLDALIYLHSQSILYRDVKPENVMIDARGYCVLVDFGFARVVPPQEKAFTVCGTPLYLAPEVILNRGYHRSADNWSYGCLVYELLVGQNPFYCRGITKIQLFKRIVRGDYSFPDWASLTDTAVHFIASILVVNPYRRLGGGAGGGSGSGGVVAGAGGTGTTMNTTTTSTATTTNTGGGNGLSSSTATTTHVAAAATPRVLTKTDADIRNHPWLAEHPPHLMEAKQMTPPWVPPADADGGTGGAGTNFENWDHVKRKLEQRPASELKLSRKEQTMFEGF
jgi:hypothetical protein